MIADRWDLSLVLKADALHFIQSMITEFINTQFVTIKEDSIQHNSKVFKSGKYLVVKSTLRLLNAFGQSEDTPLDGSDFISINEYALDGCKSHKFVNLFSGGKFTTYENSFTGSGFMEQPFANGLKAFRTQYGTTILDIDENADIVILPEGKIKFHQLKPAKCVKVSDAKSLYYAARLAPEKIILEPGSSTAEPFDNADDFVEALYCIRSLKTIESHIPQYKTVDGVLYNKDMSALLVCPRGKNGNITIPEGVTKIKEFAFANSKIEKVSFPDTLKKIEKHAFYECSRLKSVDFGNGIEEVGGVNVFAFSSIAKLEIPPQVKAIGDPRYVYVVAYKTYRKTKNKYTKEFLADRQKYVAKAIALEMEEKDFIDFVKLDFINLKYDADIVKCLEKQNWNVALAYILEEGKNNNNDAFVI